MRLRCPRSERMEIDQTMMEQTVPLLDAELPAGPIDLSARMRELRARSGLKQSEIARRMGLDPSIPSLWEQGKRPVPPTRLRSLADALGVTVGDLLHGGDAAGIRTAELRSPAPFAPAARPALERPVTLRAPLMTLLARADVSAAQPSGHVSAPAPRAIVAATEPPVVSRRTFLPRARPPLTGTIPAGWEPGDRVQDIGPSLLDGFWLDPVRMEKAAARALLRSRLEPRDIAAIDGLEVPGAALVERIYQTQRASEAFLSGRLPLIETIFRLLLVSEYGGLPVDELIEMLQGRQGSGAVQVTRVLLSRFGDSVRPYPIRWVDRELFG